jgi:tetratricopeptide (TPR) repeat protein
MLSPGSQRASMAVPSVAFLAVRIESPLALKTLEDVVNAQPDSYTAKLLLENITPQRAKMIWRSPNSRQPSNLLPIRWEFIWPLGTCTRANCRWPRAVEEYRAELALDPDNNIALAQLGHALTEAHDASNAGLVLQQALRPNPANAYIDLGKVWEMQGDSRKAIQAYESVLRYDPSQSNLHYKLSRLYQKQGQTEQAQKELAAFRAGEAQQQKNDRKAVEALQNP